MVKFCGTVALLLVALALVGPAGAIGVTGAQPQSVARWDRRETGVTDKLPGVSFAADRGRADGENNT